MRRWRWCATTSTLCRRRSAGRCSSRIRRPTCCSENRRCARRNSSAPSRGARAAASCSTSITCSCRRPTTASRRSTIWPIIRSGSSARSISTAVGLLALLFVLKLVATTVSLGCGASGGIFSPSLYLGATLGGAFAAAVGVALPHAGLTVPSAAIVGMASMVGAGTGGVMTAIVMIFEMTRDYAIIVPVIVAVAVSAGVRRALIGETIYTIKLRHRGHRIPKERHYNLYLVKQAQDVMERRFHLVEAGTSLKDALSEDVEDDLRAIVADRPLCGISAG